MQKAITILLMSFIGGFWFQATQAQCVIDSTQTTAGIYPDTLPVATAGQPYAVDVTFVMLTDTLGLTIYNYQIASVVGLPVGLNWQCNNFGNGCNYDPSVSIFGCVNITGTPVLPGNYTMTITVIADVQLVGQQNISFDQPFEVLPGTVNNPGFSMQNSLGCTPLTVDFVNNNPGQLAYLWDFGNGLQSTQENPPSQTYTTPGTYVVTQTVTPNTSPAWYLTGITVTSIPNNYGGFIDDPDMYFLLFDPQGNQVYDSHPAIDNTFPPVTWSTPNIPLLNGNYTIHVWDEDGGLFGADDDLGEITFAGNGVSGTASGSVGGATGLLIIDYTIFETPVVPLVATDTIYVYESPATPIIISSGSLVICEGDSLSLSTNDTINQIQWYESGIILAGDTAMVFNPIVSGSYNAVVSSVNGCTATSLPTIVVINPLPIKPTFFVNGNIFTTGVTGLNLQWYFNNIAITGATGSSITAAANGTYQLCATDVNGCENCSDTLAFVGVGLNTIASNGFQIFPNPSDGRFTVLFENTGNEIGKLELFNALGTLVDEVDITGKRNYVRTSKLESGVYFVVIERMGKRYFEKLIIR
ncbi:MAG: T9SS type A sorting domain-containing protein [Bacteroidetes bacterium]|nr:T9SS type A sorting domain-containing protein [Bacteroidota bacterium]